MKLPKLETPTYKLKIPSSNKTITYRPFLVKEEKILLVAQETGQESDILNAISQIVESCTEKKVKIEDLTNYDLEYIFLQLRSKSVGENAEFSLKCSKCDQWTDIELNLSEVNVTESTENPKIMLNDSVGIVMKHLSVIDIAQLSKIEKSEDVFIKTIIQSIKEIFDSDNVYPIEDSTEEELIEFVESLNREQLKKIEKFIEDTPTLKKEFKFNCSSCGEENTHTFEGMSSFFE